MPLRLSAGRSFVKTSPRLDDGTPFPTLYYLTQPAATAAISTLEASGFMAELQLEMANSQELQARLSCSTHKSYLAERDQLEVVEELDNFSAGGMARAS